MTTSSKTAVRERADAHRSEMVARKRAERDACSIWRPCLGCGRDFASEGTHNRLCRTCHRSTHSVGAFDEYALSIK